MEKFLISSKVEAEVCICISVRYQEGGRLTFHRENLAFYEKED